MTNCLLSEKSMLPCWMTSRNCIHEYMEKLPANVVESKTVNMFKSQLNTHWKNLDIKFMPDVYGPEVTGNTQSRRVSGASGPDV